MHKFSVDLPKKHGRGGQSALRFARLRLEKRHNYVRKVAETATQMFITNDKVNVAGVVLALDPYPDPNPDPSPIRNPNR